jgi:hypothetical protein
MYFEKSVSQQLHHEKLLSNYEMQICAMYSPGFAVNFHTQFNSWDGIPQSTVNFVMIIFSNLYELNFKKMLIIKVEFC